MTQEYVQMLRDALTAANSGIEQIHDDWLEPESWNSAGCGQAAAQCLSIWLAIEDALAAPIPPAQLRPISEAPVNTQLLEALKAALRWIDAVPSSTQLPAMPGFDRDEVDAAIQAAEVRG